MGAPRIARARLDDASETGLATPLPEGRNESDAARIALTEAGRRRRRHSGLAAEVQRLRDDEADDSERRTMMADMESISADRPE